MKNLLLPICLAGSLAALLAGCKDSPAARTDDIPENLRVPAGEVLTLQARATGVQIYRCSAGKDDPARFEWSLTAPEAGLFDRAGKQIGRHYAGPSWEAADGSKVVGEVAARASPNPNGIAWLLLKAKSTQGSGRFASVRYVQRLHTAGGNAPPDGCSQATAGREVRVPYSADYLFYIDKS